MSFDPAYNYCALPLASFACRPDMSRGRRHDEPESRTRSCFQRDRDRIIHCGAFRRLKYKTQVFVYYVGDHYRTRLSHSLEVAQISRTLARALCVNEDLAEAVALAHDLGHTPFAHMGEEYLKISMEPYGGFEHNDQSLRILTELENRYPRWRGLNLSWETLEGVIKHNGPVLPLEGGKEMPYTLARLDGSGVDFALGTHASLEAQIAAIADDIAYCAHDTEDGLRAGLFSVDELESLALVRTALAAIRAREPDLAGKILIYEMIREVMGLMVDDVLESTRAALHKTRPETPEDIRNAGMQHVSFSDGMTAQVDELRAFLFARMYRHYTVNRMWHKVERLVTDLFQSFMRGHTLMPDNWQARVVEAGGLDHEQARARIVCDYIAGMTDRYAAREHERLFNLYAGYQ